MESAFVSMIEENDENCGSFSCMWQNGRVSEQWAVSDEGSGCIDGSLLTV
jgi:hypothetical protein